MRSPLRVGVVGVGHFGRNHARIYSRMEGAELTVIADLDEDGNVGVGDMLLLFGVWGPCPGLPGCPGDFNVDGTVGVADMLEMFANWGPCP